MKSFIIAFVFAIAAAKSTGPAGSDGTGMVENNFQVFFLDNFFLII